MDRTSDSSEERLEKNIHDEPQEDRQCNNDRAGDSDDVCADNPNQTLRPMPRLKLFNKVIERGLQRLLSEASFHRFSRSFHPFSEQNPNLTKRIHKEFLSSMEKIIQDDINLMIEEGELKHKLEELDKLCGLVTDKTEAAWRPSGIPEQDISSFLLSSYKKQELYIRRELSKLRKENVELAERVREGRSKIESTEQQIVATLDHWKGSVDKLATAISPGCQDEGFDDI